MGTPFYTPPYIPCVWCPRDTHCLTENRCCRNEPINGADVLGMNVGPKAQAAMEANLAASGLTREDVLKEATEITKARGAKYGQPEDNFARIARHWRVYMKNRFDVDLALGSRDVALLMDLMKTSRLENDITHHDSWVDKAGYAACGASIKEKPSA